MGDQEQAFAAIEADTDDWAAGADAEIAAAEKPAGATAPEPTSTPTPQVDDKGEPEGEDFDRAAKFREVMSSFEAHIPQDKRQAFKSRIEQAERHFGVAAEAKELKGKFGKLTEFVTKLASRYENGEAYLKAKGPLEFLEAWDRQYGSGAVQPPSQPTPPPRDEETEEQRIVRLVQDQVKLANAPLVKEQAALKAEREQAAQAKAFAADFDPQVEAVVNKWGLADGVKASVGTAFADFAQNLYMTKVYNTPTNPESVTVASAVAEAAKIVDTLVEARTAKRPAPPRPKVQSSGAPHEKKQHSYEEAMDSLSEGLLSSLDEAIQKG